MRGLRYQARGLRAAGRAAEAVVLRLRCCGGEGGGAPAAEQDVLGLRPQATELWAAGRAAEAVVRQLRGGGGEGGGEPEAAEDVRGLRPQAPELRAAGRAAEAVMRRCAAAEGRGAVSLEQQTICESCGLKARAYGLSDGSYWRRELRAERRERWCASCAKADGRGSVSLR